MTTVCVPVYAEEPTLSVSVQADPSEVRQGETLVFEITLAGPIREMPRVEIGSLEGFNVVSTGQSQQIQVRAGKMSQTLVLTTTLAAAEKGTWTLGPVKVEYQGKRYETQPLEVKVLPGMPRPKPERPAHRLPELKGEVTL